MVEQLLKKKVEIPEDSGPILDRIQNWLRYRTGDEIGLILEEIAGAAKVRDTAYDILLRAGRVDPSVDRFLVTAGIEPQFPPQLIEAAGCTLHFLPTYSPDFNPIELAFAKLKTALRAAAARTQAALDAAIQEALEAITQADAQGWFRHCGYSLARSTP